VHETITFLLVTLPNIYRLNNVADRLSNKPFLIWLLTTPLQLKHVDTLPCSLSLMAGFADINVSRGSVATNARCGGIFNIYLTTSLPRNLPVAMSLWLHFFGPPCRSNTHTHTFNGPLSGANRVSRYQKGKTNLDFTGARDSEWQWHQLGHTQVCTSLRTDNHASTPSLSFYRPDALPAAQPRASKH